MDVPGARFTGTHLGIFGLQSWEQPRIPGQPVVAEPGNIVNQSDAQCAKWEQPRIPGQPVGASPADVGNKTDSAKWQQSSGQSVGVGPANVIFQSSSHPVQWEQPRMPGHLVGVGPANAFNQPSHQPAKWEQPVIPAYSVGVGPANAVFQSDSQSAKWEQPRVPGLSGGVGPTNAVNQSSSQSAKWEQPMQPAAVVPANVVFQPNGQSAMAPSSALPYPSERFLLHTFQQQFGETLATGMPGTSVERVASSSENGSQKAANATTPRESFI